MKKQIVILIAFASIGLSALAQIKYSTAVVAATQMNIVYIGIQNPLSIEILGGKYPPGSQVNVTVNSKGGLEFKLGPVGKTPIK